VNKLLSLSFRVNSVDHDVLVPPWRTLLEVLRENLGLIGPKRYDRPWRELERDGFIATADGQELYFHRNSVLEDAFDRLEVGTEVRFAEEQGNEGPQASTVALLG